MASFADDSFKLPDLYNFKPLYTLQPVQETREKQLKLWRDIVMSYHTHHKLSRMSDPFTFTLFKNENLQRSLNKEGIKAVIDSLVAEGLAEWEDPENPISLIIMTHSPAAIANQLFEWASSTGNIETMLTFYEIHSGDGYTASTFADVDTAILHRALDILVTQGRAIVIKGDTSDEDGIKFLP